MLQLINEIEPKYWIGLATVLTWIFTAIGWIIARQSQLKADKRQYRANYLIEALGAIAAGVNRPLNKPTNREFALGVERAIEKIQFLGTKNQVVLAQEFLKNWKSNESDEEGVDILTKLLTALRDELRSEFRQEPLDNDYSFLRFKGN